jgi:multidrug efflux pump subunit AcrA (membrane-fusion protein)
MQLRASKGPSGTTLIVSSGRNARGLALVLLVSGAGLACRAGSATNDGTAAGEARAARRSVEDIFLLTGELRAVRASSIVTPRGNELQIRWMVEDGTEVKEGERVIEFDASRLIQSIDEQRLRLQEAENARTSQERTLVAEGDRRRVAVEKAEVECEKARIDAAVPKELRAAIEWRRVQGAFDEKKAALEKARLDQEAFRVSSRSDLEVLRRTEEKARREMEVAERSLTGMSVFAPKSGIFLVSNFPYGWGPEGPRKLQPGDTLFPGYPVAQIPDPSEMEVGAMLSQVDHGAIAPGMPVRCILDTDPQRVFKGRVEDVQAVASEASQGFGAVTTAAGFPVRVSLAQADPALRPGLSVRVEVVRRNWPEAVAVPRRAVRFEKDKAYIAKKGLNGWSPVSVTACTAVDCVVEGLVEGDRVLLF